MKITRETVKEMAALAKLRLKEEDIETYVKEFTEILHHFGQIGEEDLTQWTDEDLNSESVRLREDKACFFENKEGLYRNIKNRQGTAIRIPKIVD